MDVVEKRSGKGRLLREDGSAIPVTYDFAIVEEAGVQSGGGTLSAGDPAGFVTAVTAGLLRLELEDGTSSSVLIKTADGKTAAFVFDGLMSGS